MDGAIGVSVGAAISKKICPGFKAVYVGLCSKTTSLKTILPIAAWFIFLAFAGKEFCLLHWEGALVVFAALSLVPQGLNLSGFTPARWYWFVATLFCVAYLFFPNKIAALAALPYLLLAVWLSIQAILNFLIFRKFELIEWARFAALAYWATGAAWAVCFLADIRPLNFDPIIVGLTAAHFHVAGFALTVAIYCLVQENACLINRLLGWASLLGMPLVAMGITFTKLGFSPVFEWMSALGFVAFAAIVAWRHARLFFQKKYPRTARTLWLGGSICLFAGIVLAALYALRFSFPIDWVNIPNMKIWHGTLNAVGFGWLVLKGWERSQAE